MVSPRLITRRDIVPLQGARVTPVWDTECQLGEGPHWDRDNDRVLFLDIKGRTLFSLGLKSGTRAQWDAADTLSSLCQTQDGRWLGTTKSGLVWLDIPTNPSGTLQYSPFNLCGAGAPGNRFNDGKAGPDGQYWAGVMDDAETGDPLGALHRYSQTQKSCVLDRMLVPNGPAFAPDGNSAVFADSARSMLYRVTIDGPDSSGTGTPVPILKFDADLGYPDGMTMDADGYLWVAFWDGHCVRRLSPDLTHIEQIDFPVARPTSLTITPNRLYVTSARTGLSEAELDAAPYSGALFAIEGLSVPVGPDYRVSDY